MAKVVKVPQRGTRVLHLMRGIKAELDRQHGGPVPFEGLAKYAGESPSTAFDRLHRTRQQQIEGLLCLLERIPEHARHRLINQSLRCLPSLNDPKLNHDPTVVSCLRGMLQQTTGLTIIHGATPGIRTYFCAALGHEQRGTVRGIDIHQPDWFVPVEGVTYVANERSHGVLSSLCLQNWNGLTRNRAALYVFNGTWLTVPGITDRILELTHESHCLVADEFPASYKLPTDTPRPVHILTLATDKDDRIKVNIQAR
jgi:hypothetical protein